MLVQLSGWEMETLQECPHCNAGAVEWLGNGDVTGVTHCNAGAVEWLGNGDVTGVSTL